MQRLTTILLPLAFVCHAALPAAAQTTERALYVSVLDQAGAPVKGLGPEVFQVREDGQAREVLRATPATQPIDLAVLVDTSQAATPYINDLRRALQAFVGRMAERGHNVALIGIADRPTILTDYTPVGTQLQRGVDRIFAQPGSGTTLLDALVETTRGLERREAERRAIVAITTEGTDFSNPNHRRALDALARSNAAFHALVITSGGGANLTTEEARSRGIVLDEGTRSTGGRLRHLLSSMALHDDLQQVAEELQNQYHVVYARPEALIPPSSVQVSVTTAGLTARGTPAAATRPVAPGD